MRFSPGKYAPWLLVAELLVGLSAVAPSARAGLARELPQRFRVAPFTVMSLSVGYPNDGYQLRAKKLKSSNVLAIKDSSKDHAYGHPALVLMLERSAREVARTAKGSVLSVGDLSRQDGGPLSGHVSHQSGRDADVGFYLRDGSGKPIVREHFAPFDPNGHARFEAGLFFDDYRNWLLLRAWVTDHRAGLSHIFVSQGLRWRLLEYGRAHAEFAPYVDDLALLLKQPPGVSTHDDHFHVRISCPDPDDLCHNESK